jgi:hypothetical protein
MPVKGVVHLVVRVEDLVRHVRFLVTRDLAVPCILGCHFINAHVKGIIPGDRKVELCEGGSVSLLGRYEVCHTSPETLSMSRVSNKVRVAKMAVVPPLSEPNIYVTCALAGLCLITGPDSRRMSPISLAQGVAEVHPQTPFRVRVINSSAKEVFIPYNMVIGYAET